MLHAAIGQPHAPPWLQRKMGQTTIEPLLERNKKKRAKVMMVHKLVGGTDSNWVTCVRETPMTRPSIKLAEWTGERTESGLRGRRVNWVD